MKRFFFTLFVTLFAGSAIGHAIGVDPSTSMPVAVGASAVYSFMPKAQGSLNQVVLTELFTADLINLFRHATQWVAAVPSHNEWVGNNAIRLNDIGADPEVLIDNNTYPIAVSGREDEGIILSLHKYETTNTKVTKDELYALPYDKPGSVQRQHRETLEEKTGEHGSHICAPQSDNTTTREHIIETSGEDDGSGRKRLTTKDIATLAKWYNDEKIPKMGRVLRLCNEHILDLLLEDKAFEKQYMNHTEGAIAARYYGFTIYEEFYNPIYNGSNEKKAFDAASAETDRNASVGVYIPYTAKAMGTVEMFYSDARQDPKYRSHIMGFEQWHLVVPKKKKGLTAIVSATV